MGAKPQQRSQGVAQKTPNQIGLFFEHSFRERGAARDFGEEKGAALVLREAAELAAHQWVEFGLAANFTLHVFPETRLITHAVAPISYTVGR